MYAWSSPLQLASTTPIKIRIFNRCGLEATLQHDMIIKLSYCNKNEHKDIYIIAAESICHWAIIIDKLVHGLR